MNIHQRAAKLKAWALEGGFDRAGIALLGPASRGQAFREWLARGDQAGMAYLERRTDLRVNPQEILPGACSVLCVAYQYHPLKGEEPPPGDFWPRVARYARGQDYHAVMESGLVRLANRILEAFPSCETKVYVDTGPVLERDLAARAGLGAVGKNTNLLDASGGSWFLLGELFLTLELAGDPPTSDLCGSCAECLDACPTGALPEPYRLDSRRCISYWTIEHRGVIPEAFRHQIGDWVFGCDICQEVCPVNTEATQGDHPELRLAEERRDLSLVELLQMNRETYVETFRGSPLKRAKLQGLQRNAAVAMGNSRSPRYLPGLEKALLSEEPLVRQHAAWALGKIGGEAAARALHAALETETEKEIRKELQAAIKVSG